MVWLVPYSFPDALQMIHSAGIGATTSALVSVGRGCAGQSLRTESIAVFSALVTHRPHLALTAICRATYRQRWRSGSHSDASLSPFDWLVGPSVTIRFSGSVAKSWR